MFNRLMSNKPSILTWLFVLGAVFMTNTSFAQDDDDSDTSGSILVDEGLTVHEARTLDDLLELIEERRFVENLAHQQRLDTFEREVTNQTKLLEDADNELRAEQNRTTNLETTISNNLATIADRRDELALKMGSLTELFGVIQQVAGETRGTFLGSVVSAEIPDRDIFLNELAQKMGTAMELASVEEMNKLWSLMFEHIVETGKVKRFKGTVLTGGGGAKETELVRVGAFNLVAKNGYVNYNFDNYQVVDLSRQPSGEFTSTAKRLHRAKPGDVVPFAIDPTRGSILSLETERARFGEMVGSPFGGIADGKCWLPFCDGQGGTVGSIIIMVGIIGVVLAVWRMVVLFLVRQKVNAQQQDFDNPRDDNPLGKLLQVYTENKDVDSETLQLKIGEAILHEMPALTRNISLVQVISVVAPLMGLLGTVIGMIQTFQAITLFGTGDPKIMAGGISTALMTTVLGLCVAIPTVLLHALTSQFSRSVIHVLDEQSEGLIAEHAESKGTPVREVEKQRD
ncbi:MAG: MotA/TolQ/ExbB proton channel family protein [Gammaproteobacteria bacterium]|nr:MotA/TolQ/ExbB proton channel family protein [Gammaproteobacteria bacterium]